MKPMPKYVFRLFNACIGFALGDAYGLPFVHFKKYHAHLYNQRQEMVKRKGSELPRGTWGPNSAQLLESLEVLTKNRELIDINKRELPIELLESYNQEARDSTLSRLLPIAFLLKDQSLDIKYNWVKQITSITSKSIHVRVCGFIYLELVIGLLHDLSIEEAYKQASHTVRALAEQGLINEAFQKLLSDQIGECSISDINGNSTLMDTIQAAIWVMLQAYDYKSAVHLATGIGGQTDTLAALVGGLAALVFRESFPDKWVTDLKGKDQILTVSADFTSHFRPFLI